MKHARFGVCSGVFLAGVCAWPAHAETLSWNGGGDRTTLSSPANWGTTSITLNTNDDPGFAVRKKDVVFTLAGDFEMTRMYLDANESSVTFNLYPYTLNFRSGERAIKTNSDRSSVTLASGTIQASKAKISLSSPTNHAGEHENNTFTVTGDKSVLDVKSLEINIGERNCLTVEKGAKVQADQIELASLETNTPMSGNGTASHPVGVPYRVEARENVMRFRDGANFELTGSAGLVSLCSATLSFSNTFSLVDTTVSGVSNAFKIVSGKQNAVLVDNTSFLGPQPEFCIAGGVSNRIELTNLELVRTNVRDLVAIQGGTNNVITLKGVNTQLKIQGTGTENPLLSLFPGSSVDGTIEILDGAKMIRDAETSSAGMITFEEGRDTKAARNTLRIAGEGSTFDAEGFFYVGENTDGNRLVVEDNGLVQMRTPSKSLYLGHANGKSNEIYIASGGKVYTYTFAVSTAKAQASRLVVTGSGSLMYVGNCQVGYWNLEKEPYSYSSNNVVCVTDNGKIVCEDTMRFAGFSSVLALTNGTVEVKGMGVEIPHRGFDAQYATNMHVRIGGSFATVTAKNITLSRGTDFTVDVTDPAFTGPVFKASNTCTLLETGPLYVDGPAWPKKTRRVVLTEADTTLSVDDASLAALNSALPPYGSVYVDGKALVLRVSARGLSLVIR